MTTLRFLGATGTVTGSRYLVETESARLLVDCGLFQGYKQLRLRNWARPGFDAREIDAVILTHAHIDHSGYLPVLVSEGFRNPVYSTELTRELCNILLPDAGRIQEFDAEHANRGGYARHHPAKPLFTERDALKALRYFHPCKFNDDIEVAEGVSLRFYEAGHILGASVVRLETGNRSITFSGDLGRYNCPVMRAPSNVPDTDYLLIESTYGNSDHSGEDPESALAAVVRRTAGRGGSIIIPCFAVGRAQNLLYYLSRLRRSGRIPPVPIYLDSPMAINATNLFCSHPGASRLSNEEASEVCSVAEYVSESSASDRVVADNQSKIVLSASGMATGGRVLNYLKRYAPDPRNTILFAGYQAGGTRGARMVAGVDRIKIHGAWHAVRAEVANLGMLSAHADASEIMRWLSGFRTPPRKTFVVHGEPDASDTLRQRIQEELGWDCVVPEYGQAVALDD